MKHPLDLEPQCDNKLFDFSAKTVAIDGSVFWYTGGRIAWQHLEVSKASATSPRHITDR